MTQRFIGKPLTNRQEFALLLCAAPFVAAVALWALSDRCERDGGRYDVSRGVCVMAEELRADTGAGSSALFLEGE